jgi:hypothetical protein
MTARLEGLTRDASVERRAFVTSPSRVVKPHLRSAQVDTDHRFERVRE